MNKKNFCFKVKEVIPNIENQFKKNKDAEALVNYVNSNIHRMDYSHYKSIGAGIIGSGAIESAPRTVVQKRMKQSGQRWSYEGAQNMLNLRVIKMNGQWEKIVKMVTTDFKATA